MGQDVLFAFEGAHNGLHGHGHGHHTLLNQNYETIRELRAGKHALSDKHEFIIVNETSALIQIHHPLQMNLEPYGGLDGQTWIVDARFQELDIQTGEVLFEWSSLDHTTPHETALPLPLGRAGFAYNSSTAWDYFHINSVTKGPDGHYLLSARHTSTIYKINSSDGSIIWRFGGEYSDFELGPNVTFGFQHHARYLAISEPGVDVISLFDNSVYGSEVAGGGDLEVHLYPYSRGKYIKIEHASKKASLELAFLPPQGAILAKSQGSLQTLPNENALINWGSEGQVTEFSSDAEPVFHAFLDSGSLQDKLQNYRAFRYNWTGISPEIPALVAEHSIEGINVYVSWNGDTRTKVWRFIWDEITAKGTITKSSDIKRTGFETRFRITAGYGEVGIIYAEAIDAAGRVSAISDGVRATTAYWAKPSVYNQHMQNQQLVLTPLVS
ncbi:hypothetical protein MY11210_008241 [Beauveria gryllotalpidicola]